MFANQKWREHDPGMVNQLSGDEDLAAEESDKAVPKVSRVEGSFRVDFPCVA